MQKEKPLLYQNETRVKMKSSPKKLEDKLHKKEERIHKADDKIHKLIKKVHKKEDDAPKKKLMKKPKAKKKVAKVMREFESGELHSGSKKGPIVTNPKQAIAIGLSEARKAKAKVAKKK